MRKLILLAIIIIYSFSVSAQNSDIDTLPVTVEGDKIYRSVDQVAEFPGGMQGLLKYLSSTTRYPKEALEQNIEGKVIVQLVVSKSGKVTKVELKRDIGGGCGEEACRVVRNMPEWKPAMQNGKAVNVYYTLPISFKLVDDTVSSAQQPAQANLARIDTLAAPQVLRGKGEFIFEKVDQMPEFPGGIQRLVDYLNSKIKYPERARQNSIEGKVFVQFIVSKSGKVTNVEVKRDIGHGCGEEAYRVVSNMPDWKPGKIKGEPVNVYFTLPISFRLSDPEPLTPVQSRFR